MHACMQEGRTDLCSQDNLQAADHSIDWSIDRNVGWLRNDVCVCVCVCVSECVFVLQRVITSPHFVKPDWMMNWTWYVFNIHSLLLSNAPTHVRVSSAWSREKSHYYVKHPRFRLQSFSVDGVHFTSLLILFRLIQFSSNDNWSVPLVISYLFYVFYHIYYYLQFCSPFHASSFVATCYNLLLLLLPYAGWILSMVLTPPPTPTHSPVIYLPET